ncbi:hypothetical protein [Pseudoflavitalea rhizosphaerae]|uniref:hypothetical protein n=1 Tax=Pseudoflavitalea rhizosphaerae TaxID=1884793 RepID=UPI000F8C7172|nr:hypothetical protein [Pseudoflavitalea rhizosphaerae]
MKFLFLITLLATTIAPGIQAATFPTSICNKKAPDPIPLVTWGSSSVTYIPNPSAQAVQFSFTTTFEFDVEIFEIQRYHWATGWQTIGFVFAGSGSYSYTDVGLVLGETYQYRAAGVSLDESRTPWSYPLTITLPVE